MITEDAGLRSGRIIARLSLEFKPRLSVRDPDVPAELTHTEELEVDREAFEKR